MTVSSSVNKVIYSGNSATVLFPVSYYFLENSHLKVILRAADGTETVQALTTNYTVTGAGNPAGGSVTMLVAPPTGTTLTIVRNVPATQETDYLANDPFPAESHERALDKLTMLVQENEEVASRALVVPASTPTTVNTTLPNPTSLGILAWNQNANAINYISPSDIGTAVAYATAYADTFDCDGVDQTFTLSANPVVINNLDVSINGSTQVPNVDYTLSGTTLTMTTPPPVNSVLLAKYKQGLPNFSGDSQDIRYVPAGTGAVNTTVQAKLRETVSVKDFGAVGDGVTDDTAAMQAAHNTGRVVYYPTGRYKFSTLTNIQQGGIVGDGQTQSVLISTDVTNANLITFVGASVGGPANSLVFQDFLLEGQVAGGSPAKSGGAGISVSPVSGENSYLYASNVTFNYIPIGIDFVRASYFSIFGCKFLAYNIAGIQVANANNNDSGDSCVIGCVFNCPYDGGSLPAGIKHLSSGGLRIIGNKFLGGNYGYRLVYTDVEGIGRDCSILILSSNSIENFHTNAISLEKVSAGLTSFKNVIISDNEIAIALASPSAFLITSDSGSWLQSVTITGNTFQLPGVTNSSGIDLTGVTALNISGNTFRGNGGTSKAIALTSCSDVKVGTNVYSNISIPYSFVTPVANNTVILESQSGTVTTAASGWASYFGTDLYISPTVTITFPTPFLIAPQASDVQFSLSSGDGSLSGIVVAVSTTQLQVAVVASKTNFAAEIYWKVSGVL